MKVLSFGGGVQTVTLAAMSVLGEYEPPDLIIMADTGWETKATYDYVKYFQGWLKEHSQKIIIRSKGNIRTDALSGRRFASMPMFTVDKNGKKGMLMRQCTNEYKIQVVYKTIREFLGMKKYQRVKDIVSLWLGISCDEATRQKPSRVPWIKNCYPLIEKRLTRRDCIKYLNANKIPIPTKSACIGCPYHSDDYWRFLKNTSPLEFEDACSFDEFIRDKTKQGIESPIFLHSARKPLRSIDFSQEPDLFEDECEGYCGL